MFYHRARGYPGFLGAAAQADPISLGAAVQGGVNPLVFSLARDGLSFPLLEAIALAVDGPLLPASGDIARFVCLGVFGMFGNQFCYILGLVYIDAGLASVINLLTPVCAWMFATAIGLDRFSWPQAGGVVCAVGGAMIFVGLLDPSTYGGGAASPGGGGSASGSAAGGPGNGGGGGSDSSFADTLKGSLAVFGSCVTMSICEHCRTDATRRVGCMTVSVC
jgi:drug/metabolite transporter (DMT)-like permease